jgi:hypothetical protein
MTDEKTSPKPLVAVVGIDFPKVRVEAGEPVPDKVKVPKWLIDQGLVREAD